METPTALRRILCQSWCEGLDVADEQDGSIRMSMPLHDPDGDAITVWARTVMGGWRLSDGGATIMRLSYEHDLDSLLDGSRGKVFERLLSESGLREEEGELAMETQENELGGALLRFGQGLLRVGDLKLWTRNRIANSFYDDLRTRLEACAGRERVHQDYAIPNIPGSGDYPVDFYVEGGSEPLYVFGVPGRDKARLATIVLQHLQTHVPRFNSLVVFQNAADLGNADLRRLMNAANDMVDSIDATDALERKLRHRLQAA